MSESMTQADLYPAKLKFIQEAIALYLSHRPAPDKSAHIFSLKKASVSHRVPQLHDCRKKTKKIDISSLNTIIEIDKNNLTCRAEAGVTFEQVVKETLKYRLIPPIVPELKTITLGGAIAGCSVESMSFRYGGFHNCCLEYELVTGTGETLVCSPAQHADVFNMLPNSFGTLGVLTSIRFKLIPAKAYIHITYIKYASFKELMQAIRHHYQQQDIDFMDAIVHAPDACVLCLGSFTDDAPYVHTYDWEIYYKSTRQHTEDYLSVYDYLFRYDRECHWLTRNYGLENRLLRFLFGSFFLGSSKMLKLAHKLPIMNYSLHGPKVVADVFIPYTNSEEFFDWYLKLFNFFPLWVVPYHMDKAYPWLNPALMQDVKDTLFIDCAIYGFKQDKSHNYYKELEKKVFALKGIKTLITHNYYDESEFWQSFNKDMYDKIKAQTDPCNIFGQLYTKTKTC
jgi:FAD/FMN-containing dehydrogenase